MIVEIKAFGGWQRCKKEKIESGELHTDVNGMELMAYISSAYTGIQSSCIVHNCYHRSPIAEVYQPKPQFKILAKTVKYLLGAKE